MWHVKPVYLLHISRKHCLIGSNEVIWNMAPQTFVPTTTYGKYDGACNQDIDNDKHSKQVSMYRSLLIVLRSTAWISQQTPVVRYSIINNVVFTCIRFHHLHRRVLCGTLPKGMSLVILVIQNIETYKNSPYFADSICKCIIGWKLIQYFSCIIRIQTPDKNRKKRSLSCHMSAFLYAKAGINGCIFGALFK